VSIIKNLNLEVNESGIVVNNYMQTSIENIYTIGDANNYSKFSNAAIKEALTAINHIRGIRSTNKNQFIYRFLGKSEYAYIGLSEEETISKNIRYKKLTISEDQIIENYNQIRFV